MVTLYAVLAFRRDEDGKPVPAVAREMPDGERAARFAHILAADPANCGAVAFSRTGDPALGDWFDTAIIKVVGDIGELTTQE